MKQATKTSRKSTATKQVKRVVATIALATAAGTAAAPAFAADCDTDRGDDGVGRTFGSDRPGAAFGGTGRGVEVKDDGTVEVRRGGGPTAGVGTLVPDVAGDAADAVTEVVDDVEDVVEAPAEAVEDVTDTVETVTEPVTDPVTEVVEGVEDVTTPKPADPGAASGKESPGKSSDAPGKGAAGTGQGTEKASGAGGGKSSAPGGQAQEKAGADAAYFAAADIRYSVDRDEPAAELPAPGAAEEPPSSGELLAFQATAKVLGFSPESLSDHQNPPAGYEPRHMKDADEQDGGRGSWGGDRDRSSHGGDRGARGEGWFSHGGERQAEDKVADDTTTERSSRGLRAGLGLGDVDVKVLASGGGLDVSVTTGELEAQVRADRSGVSVETDVKNVADAALGAGAQGVEASAGAAKVGTVDLEAAGNAEAAAETGEAGTSGVAQDASQLAERGARPFESSAHSFLEQHPQEGIEPAASGAEFLSYQPSAVDKVAEDAEAATREATIDAPLRVATTGTEAAALTGLAGALVVGGAGALLVANRSGRNGDLAPATLPTTTA